MNPVASYVDLITISSGLLLWSTTVIGFVWWLNSKFNSLLIRTDYEKRHDELMERVRQMEIKVAKLCQQSYDKRPVK